MSNSLASSNLFPIILIISCLTKKSNFPDLYKTPLVFFSSCLLDIYIYINYLNTQLHTLLRVLARLIYFLFFCMALKGGEKDVYYIKTFVNISTKLA